MKIMNHIDFKVLMFMEGTCWPKFFLKNYFLSMGFFIDHMIRSKNATKNFKNMVSFYFSLKGTIDLILEDLAYNSVLWPLYIHVIEKKN